MSDNPKNKIDLTKLLQQAKTASASPEPTPEQMAEAMKGFNPFTQADVKDDPNVASAFKTGGMPAGEPPEPRVRIQESVMAQLPGSPADAMPAATQTTGASSDSNRELLEALRDIHRLIMDLPNAFADRFEL